MQILLHCFDCLNPITVINLGHLSRGFIVGFIVHLLTKWMDGIASNICQNPGALDLGVHMHKIHVAIFRIDSARAETEILGFGTS